MTNPPVPPPAGYWTPNAAPRLGSSARAPVNYMAWTGLIVSVSGFILNLGVNGIVGAIFSLIGLRDARRLAAEGHVQTGRSQALAGLITGIVHTIVTAGLVVLAILGWFWFIEWIETLTTQVQYSNLS